MKEGKNGWTVSCVYMLSAALKASLTRDMLHKPKRTTLIINCLPARCCLPGTMVNYFLIRKSDSMFAETCSRVDPIDKHVVTINNYMIWKSLNEPHATILSVAEILIVLLNFILVVTVWTLWEHMRLLLVLFSYLSILKHNWSDLSWYIDITLKAIPVRTRT